MNEFITSLNNLKREFNNIIKNKIDLSEDISESAVLSYEERKRRYYKEAFKKSLEQFKSKTTALYSLMNYKNNRETITTILELLPLLDTTNIENLKKTIEKIQELAKNIEFPKEETELNFKINNIPKEIEGEMLADLKELKKCFSNGCYRSCVILCARLLEIALHRKYYEVTDEDLLEKAPGIGLGNIVAKLKENKVKLDPAIMQQVHLINQVRIYSVHKKKEVFYPSKEQTHAIILYTLDCINKLFERA